MKIFGAILILASLTQATSASATCSPGVTATATCLNEDAVCFQRGTPSSTVVDIANASITTANLCPGADVTVNGIRATPGGYTEYGYSFIVGSNSQVVFQYLTIDNEQKPVPPGEGACTAWFNCSTGSIDFIQVGFEWN